MINNTWERLKSKLSIVWEFNVFTSDLYLIELDKYLKQGFEIHIITPYPFPKICPKADKVSRIQTDKEYLFVCRNPQLPKRKTVILTLFSGLKKYLDEGKIIEIYPQMFSNSVILKKKNPYKPRFYFIKRDLLGKGKLEGYTLYFPFDKQLDSLLSSLKRRKDFN